MIEGRKYYASKLGMYAADVTIPSDAEIKMIDTNIPGHITIYYYIPNEIDYSNKKKEGGN